MTEYIERKIDSYLDEWRNSADHKPLLLRGARQVGKSSAVRQLGQKFKYFAEVNFERQKSLKSFFAGDIDVRLISSKIANVLNIPIVEGETLLFLDEIQECPEAIMALRFYREDFPKLHVIAAGSLLEFALSELPTFGVGRIHSLFLYPMTFDEFLVANGKKGLLKMRDEADQSHPLDEVFHQQLIEQFRLYLLVGGMPEAVVKWVETKDFLKVQQVQQNIVLTYEDDFHKYKSRVKPDLLRICLHGICHSVGEKVSMSSLSRDYRSSQIREALNLLTLAGLLTPVLQTAGNGIPLEAESDDKQCKYLFLDSGLLLAILQLDDASAKEMVNLILTGTPQEVVNKGGLAEMVAGLELFRHKMPIQRYKMFYWTQGGKSIAEVDYLEAFAAQVTPIEVKSGTQGGMKSLWLFMREKHLTHAIRTSLENFGSFDYTDPQDGNTVRKVSVVPLYALSGLRK